MAWNADGKSNIIKVYQMDLIYRVKGIYTKGKSFFTAICGNIYRIQ